MRPTIRERIALFLLRKSIVVDDGPLSDGQEMQIAIETALEAAVGLAIAQDAIINEILDQTEKIGISINIGDEIALEIQSRIDTLHASQVVIGENIGMLKVPKEPKND